MSALEDIALTREPLDVAAATARVTCAEAGGIAIFLGTTRAEIAPDRKDGDLLALDYHAYEEMAQTQLKKLVDAARQRWPIQKAIVWHRLGNVAVGESSVLVAVSCPHRDAAFAACAWLMDELKKIAPIWKREVYQGTTRWQGQE